MRYVGVMKPDASHELDLETVFEAMGTEAEMEAIGIMSMLEGSGIPAVLIGSSSLPTLPFQIKVPRDHVEEARRTIQDGVAAGSSGAEEALEGNIERAAGLIQTTVPILPALDLDETLVFYRQLGFAVCHRGEEYAIVDRDEMALHFWKCDNREIPENSSCYIHSSDLKALHAEFKSSGVGTLSDMEQKPWRMTEFQVVDPNGNLLRFGQAIQ